VGAGVEDTVEGEFGAEERPVVLVVNDALPLAKEKFAGGVRWIITNTSSPRTPGFFCSGPTSASCTADETPSRYSLDLPRAREMLTNGMAILPVGRAWR
jgi:hypothetical protein